MATKPVSRILVLPALASLLGATSGALADSCEANVNGSLTREERDGGIVRLSFKVDVDTEASCGETHYVVILEIQNDDGETDKKKLARQVRLHDGSISELVTHELSSGQSLVDWEVKLDSCSNCP